MLFGPRSNSYECRVDIYAVNRVSLSQSLHVLGCNIYPVTDFGSSIEVWSDPLPFPFTYVTILIYKVLGILDTSINLKRLARHRLSSVVCDS
jgi:hypothetical protein